MFNYDRYQVIYLDPPWSYADSYTTPSRKVDNKYHTMSGDELQKLDFLSVVDDDCAMFCWATSPMLPLAIDLMEMWGFTYKTVAFVWVKTNKRKGNHFWGMGHWTRSNVEHVLLGTRGKPKRKSAAVHQVVEQPLDRGVAHSRKPDVVRDKITALMGDVPRVELFATQRVEGWDCVGFDVNNIDVREFLKPDFRNTIDESDDLSVQDGVRSQEIHTQF